MKSRESIENRPENIFYPMEYPREKEKFQRRRVCKDTFTREEREESIVAGMQELAAAVIDRAWIDAKHWRDSYNRQMSRNFLTGSSRDWRESLENWCGCCGKSAKGILETARKQFWDQEKIEHYRRDGR